MKRPPMIAPKTEGTKRGQMYIKNSETSPYPQAATICRASPTAGLMQVLPVILYQK